MLSKIIHRVDIHRRFSLALLIAVVSTLVLLVGVASGASISSPEWDRPSEHPIYEITESEARAARAASLAALQLKVQEQGSVRVIVGLNVAFQPEGDLASPQAIQDQQARIAGAQDALLERLESFGVKSVGRFEYIPFIALEVDAEALEDLGENPDVISLEEDVPVPPTLASSIPVIGADDAWAAGYEGSGWAVAILDTGVDSSHSFLTGKVVSEACYSATAGGSTTVCPGGGEEETGSGTGVNCDISIYGCNHGTHVAGIAAGKNGPGYHGVAREANLIAIQVFTRFSGTDCTDYGLPSPCSLSYTSDQIKGLEHVYALRTSFNIAAANMSLGGGSYSSYCDATQSSRKAAIDNLRSVNIATVISSGNSGYRTSIGAPACISTAISVGSTTDSDVVSSFSNVASFLSLLAPGSSIDSSVPGGGYDNFNGTSMSAPHVTGAWAVLKSKMASASVDDILTAFQTSGVTVNDTRSGGTVTGMKRIQVDAALNALSVSNWIYLPLVMKDFSSGIGPTPTPTSEPSGWVTILNETFEGAFPGVWQVSDEYSGSGEYYWAKRDCKPYSGSYSGWAVGGGANGGSLSCGSNYPNYANSWMVYGPFSLVDATAADLGFKFWLNSELNYDGLCWMASINGNNFYGNCMTGNSSGWSDGVLDLTNVYTLGDLRGEPNVWVLLSFISDSSFTYAEGAYVDDILLRKCTSGSCPSGGGAKIDLIDGQIIEFPSAMTLQSE